MTTGVWGRKTEGKREVGHGLCGRRTWWKCKEDTVKVEGHGGRGKRTR